MNSAAEIKRYADVTETKAEGATYTPSILADFVAERMLEIADLPDNRPVRLIDPAVGHGELLGAVLSKIDRPVEVFGYETDQSALGHAIKRLHGDHPNAHLFLKPGNFLDHVVDDFSEELFGSSEPYDLVIANPPYVRTQIIGAERAQLLARQFGLAGRVDLYHAFLLGMARVLAPAGTAGFIVSNRFMTTKSGASVRASMLTDIHLSDIFDLGDTKLFEAAILPAVLIANGKGAAKEQPGFHSIYQSSTTTRETAQDPLDALAANGPVKLPDGRTFDVRHGTLDNGDDVSRVWRLASPASERWLGQVEARKWGTFRDIGKIRVGVKTAADRVFIPKAWDEDLELHRPLTTHHIGRRFRAASVERKILYPHEMAGGRRCAVNLGLYPKSKAYLEAHREVLESRTYVLEAGRRWYEIWVPQQPEQWSNPKLVFRDISEKPAFWMDLEGTVVNGDCYWLIGDNDLLWLALAVANSTFIERFYDLKFNNKLYAGRRRFITQYVEQFPLPDPAGDLGRAIVDTCKRLYERLPGGPEPEIEHKLDEMVWSAFGLSVEEV